MRLIHCITLPLVAAALAGCARDQDGPTAPRGTLPSASLGASSTTTFESFTTGVSVNYQGPGTTTLINGYTIPSPYGSLWTVVDEWGLGRLTDANLANDFDERVVEVGGSKVWRFSNAVTSPGFSDQPNTPSSPLVAGETSAFLWNDRGPNHTTPINFGQRAGATTTHFNASLRFRSVTGASQPGLQLFLSPGPRQSSWRMSNLSIVDSGTGFNIGFIDVSAGGATFPSTTIATGLSYTGWHKLDIYMEFLDGLSGDGSGNDVVKIYVNDVLVHTGTSWETYYRAVPSIPDVIAVDALMIRAAGTAAPDNAGYGLFFDDVVVGNDAPPAATPTCTAGTYLDGTTCVPAPAGSFVPVDGATEATLCPVGTYQDEEGQTSCILADIGFFVDVAGAVAQTPCPAGTTTIATGSTSCIALIAFQSSTTGMTNGPKGDASRTLTIGLPANVSEGDLLLAQITFEKGSDASITAPTGWQLVRRTDRLTDIGQAIYSKVATDDESASYSWSFSQSVKAAGGISHYTGVDSDDPIVASSGAGGDSRTLTAPGVTAADGSVLVSFFGFKKKDTMLSVPTGMTGLYNFQNPQDVTMRAADEARDVGPTGNRTSTPSPSNSDKWVAQNVVLRWAHGS